MLLVFVMELVSWTSLDFFGFGDLDVILAEAEKQELWSQAHWD